MILHLYALAAAAASTPLDADNCSAVEHKARLPRGITLSDIELPSDAGPGMARQKFEEYGVLLVRGLQRTHAARIAEAAQRAHDQSLALLNAGKLSEVRNGDHVVGWVTPDQTLFIPAPEGHVRDKQAMVLGLDYLQDASMLAAASDSKTLDILEEMTSWRDIELFGKGQLFYKEGIANAASPGGVSLSMMGTNASGDVRHGERMAPGGNPKYLHQDSAYFMFAREGAVASLSFAVDVSGELDNGPLYVVPGSHRLGHLPHVDTPSHLGVPADDWSFDDALRIDASAGDVVFFHIHTLHGSPPNRSPRPRPVYINRYLEASDYQTYFATDARMRERARAAYEEGRRDGKLPAKERGYMVRGWRQWSDSGPEWKLNAAVNH